jgi:hypothetical protein
MMIFGLRIEEMTYKIWYVIGPSPWNPPREFSTTATPAWALPPENDARVPLDPMERILPIALVTLFVSAIGTALAVIFGWRAERRQNKELQLGVLQLESQLAQGQRSNEKPT